MLQPCHRPTCSNHHPPPQRCATHPHLLPAPTTTAPCQTPPTYRQPPTSRIARSLASSVSVTRSSAPFCRTSLALPPSASNTTCRHRTRGADSVTPHMGKGRREHHTSHAQGKPTSSHHDWFTRVLVALHTRTRSVITPHRRVADGGAPHAWPMAATTRAADGGTPHASSKRLHAPNVRTPGLVDGL
eukprot:234807-Chlamydomonas_euryale.AAC.2